MTPCVEDVLRADTTMSVYAVRNDDSSATNNKNRIFFERYIFAGVQQTRKKNQKDVGQATNIYIPPTRHLSPHKVFARPDIHVGAMTVVVQRLPIGEVFGAYSTREAAGY